MSHDQKDQKDLMVISIKSEIMQNPFEIISNQKSYIRRWGSEDYLVEVDQENLIAEIFTCFRNDQMSQV
jgi:hypothetical protein